MTTHRRSLLKKASFVAASLPFVPEAWAQTLGYPRALQGPMVGAPTATSISVWVRTSGTFNVELEVATRRDFADARRSAPMAANETNDYCVVPRMEGLTPATTYFYRLRLDGALDRYQPLPYHTRTAPRARANFRAAFGSCARLQIDTDQRIFTVVQALEPDLMFFLGDNIYADTGDPAAIADLYRRQREIATLERQIGDDVKRAVRERDRLVRAVAAAEVSVQIGKREVEIAQTRYERGLSDNLDVVSAERARGSIGELSAQA